MENQFSILGYATQDDDGPSYIEDRQDKLPKFKQELSIKSMMGVVKEHTNHKMDNDDAKTLESDGDRDEEKVTSKKMDDDSRLWYLLLGHSKPLKEIKSLVGNGHLLHTFWSKMDCDVCARGKFRRKCKGSLMSAT